MFDNAEPEITRRTRAIPDKRTLEKPSARRSPNDGSFKRIAINRRPNREYTRRIKLKDQKLTAEGGAQEDGGGSFAIALVMLFFTYMYGVVLRHCS